jgi:hypothetical protein
MTQKSMVLPLDFSYSTLTSKGTPRSQRSLCVDKQIREESYGTRGFSDYQVEKSISMSRVIRPPHLHLHSAPEGLCYKRVKGYGVRRINVTSESDNSVLGGQGWIWEIKGHYHWLWHPFKRTIWLVFGTDVLNHTSWPLTPLVWPSKVNGWR